MRKSLKGPRLLMTADAVGGVFQYALDLARGLDSLGVQTVLAVLGPPMNEGQRELARKVNGLAVIETGLPLDWLALGPESVADAAQTIAGVAILVDADLVHLNTPALAAADFNAPVLAVAHSCLASWWRAVKKGQPPVEFHWRTELMAKGLRAADRVICPSHAFARQLSAIYGISPIVIHNGRSRTDSHSGGSAGFTAPYAFTAGRLWDEGKNLRVIDQAAGQIDVPLYAAGPLSGPNQAMVKLLHAQPLGPLCEEELRSQFGQRPIYVAASRYEPFGLTVLEAAQAGCPLVLSDIPTFRELWGGAAVFVSPDHADAFAQAISGLISAPVLRAAFGAAARERAEKYTIETLAARMMGVYREILEGDLMSCQGAAA